MESVLKEEMIEIFETSTEEIELVLVLTFTTLLMPINFINKLVFAKLTNHNYKITVTDFLDFAIVGVVFFLWYIVLKYESDDIKYNLFSPEEDSTKSVKFMGNISFNVIDDTFHFDYLMAALTALYWFRCIVLLRLSETFGPLLVMIVVMVKVMISFFVIFFLGLLTFSSIGTLTLAESVNFRNLFEAFRIYLMAALGNFDIMQYDDLEGWKKYYAILLHVAVLFFFLILIINLLIAILSDEYAKLAEVKQGLYWGKVIEQMPKYRYDKKYGVLSMFPFAFSFMGFFLIPFLLTIEDDEVLQSINTCTFYIVYSMVLMVTMPVFMAVNLLLAPFAYLKTVVHKFKLHRHYKASSTLSSFLLYIVAGLPLLVCSQIMDLYYFTVHTFSDK